MDSSYSYFEPHFLEACFLCGRPLGFNSDIFMYRGNTPFCSKECREEQIEMDETHDKKMKASAASSRSSSLRSSSDPKPKDSDTVRSTTLVVA